MEDDQKTDVFNSLRLRCTVSGSAIDASGHEISLVEFRGSIVYPTDTWGVPSERPAAPTPIDPTSTPYLDFPSNSMSVSENHDATVTMSIGKCFLGRGSGRHQQFRFLPVGHALFAVVNCARVG